MGNSASSTSSTTSPVQQCLVKAVGESNVAFKGSTLYQVTDVKPYNLDLIVTPTAVTYPSTADQVAAIVKCAADNNLHTQPRSGGHSYANYGIGGQDGAIVVDMKHFQQFSMDKSTWQATVGSGTLLGDLNQRLIDNGNRAVTHGTCPQVGIGGHATIGGLGPTSRMWGPLLDHIEEVEVVLANSTIVRASEKQYPDVFFAIRGAAAGFGIVTEFKLRTQEAPGNSVAYSYTLQGGSTQEKADIFKKWQKLISDPQLTRKFNSQFILTKEVGAIVSGTYFGSQAEFDSMNLTSRLSLGSSKQSVELKDWLGLVGHWAEDITLKIVGGIPSHFYAKSLTYTDQDLIPDDEVDKLFNYIDQTDDGGAVSFMTWYMVGGATSDVASDATAYGQRDALFFHEVYAVNLLGKIKDKTRAYLNGINDLAAAARSDRYEGAYAGSVDPDLGANSASDYWDGNVDKLQRIKGEVDPQNVFSNPQSIKPPAKSAKKRHNL